MGTTWSACLSGYVLHASLNVQLIRDGYINPYPANVENMVSS